METPDADEPEVLGFEQLAALRDELQPLLLDAPRSLKQYHAPGTGGFAHRVDPNDPTPPKDWSKSSTATCIAFLRATGRLADDPWGNERATLVAEIMKSDWDTAKLGPGNAFTVAFLLEALADLGVVGSLEGDDAKLVSEHVGSLVSQIKAEGGIRLQDYNPTAFLTFKAVSALNRWDRLDEVRGTLEKWNWDHLNKESVLVASQTVDADVFEVAYSVLIASALAPLDRMTPQQRNLLRFAIGQFFTAQRKDGAWPRSRPLFVYPGLGHAYCFEFELLAAMLSDSQLRPLMFERLPKLRRAAASLEGRKYPLKRPRGRDLPPYGWSSGHHGSDALAESWSTAAVLHFCFVLDRLVAEAVRRETFRYVGADYKPPLPEPGEKPYLPTKFLDSLVTRRDDSKSLKKAFTRYFINPLVANRSSIEQGKPFPEGVWFSAILYGPPGTSKTTLAEYLAKALGWPLLPLDPSHLTRHGLDQVHAEASRLFGMLQRCEQIVVLLDEFDELVREREGAGELETRFLTTAMLPKLTALSNERRIVYLVATNHIEQFDAAIRRPGRFDVIVPVMPPTADEKCSRWPSLKKALDLIGAPGDKTRDQAILALGDLTFHEAKELKDKLIGAQDRDDVIDLVRDAARRSTLSQPVAPPGPDGRRRPTWKEQLQGQSDRIRGLGF